MTDIRALADAHTSRLIEALGGDVTEVQKATVARAGELLGLASAMRAKLIADGAGDLAALMKCEQLAQDAVAALRIPAAPAPKPEPLHVVFCSEFDTKLSRLLKDRPDLTRDELVGELSQRVAIIEEERNAARAALESARRALEEMQAAAEISHHGPIAGRGGASGERSGKVVPLRTPSPSWELSDSPWAALGSANSGMNKTLAPHLDASKHNWPTY